MAYEFLRYNMLKQWTLFQSFIGLINISYIKVKNTVLALVVSNYKMSQAISAAFIVNRK